METVIKNGTVKWLVKDGYGKKKVFEAPAEPLYKQLKEHYEKSAAEEPKDKEPAEETDQKEKKKK